MERKYMMYEGEDVNTIDLLYEAPTTECNGVKVIIPVKWNDKDSFVSKIKEQLAYFENVYFNVNGIDNSFNIFRAENYQFSELASNNDLHVCLDNVYYPLDFEKLGVDRISVPIGLKFSLTDGLFPTPNREALRYTQEAKTIILDKISKIASHLITEYNKTLIDTEDVTAVFEHFKNSSRNVSVIDNTTFNVKGLESYSSVAIKQPVLKNVKLLSSSKLYEIKDYLLSEYVIASTLYKDKYSNVKGFWNSKVDYKMVNNEDLYIYSGSFTGNKRIYMKSTLNTSNNTKYFIKKQSSFPLFGKSSGYDNYHTILNLDKFPKDKWRDVIKEFQYVQSYYVNQFKDLDSIDIPKQWSEARRKKPLKVDSNGVKRVKLSGEIIVKEATALCNYSTTKNCKFVSQTYALKDFYKLKNLYVYTSHDNADKLDKLYQTFNKQYVKFITFSARELTAINKIKIHNLVPLEEFMEGKTQPFKRVITAGLIYRLISDNYYVFEKLSIIPEISKDLYERLSVLREYNRNNHLYITDELFNSMLVIAQENNLFDIPVYQEYLSAKKDLEQLYFLNAIMQVFPAYSKPVVMVKAIVDLCKYHKFKVNTELYSNSNAVIAE
jgi:hypothetical protein